MARATNLEWPEATPARRCGTELITVVVERRDGDRHSQADRGNWWEEVRSIVATD